MERRKYPRARLASALAALIVLAWTGMVFAVMLKGRRDEARAVDAIVVLGAAQYEGRPSPVLRARLDHALDLYHRGLAPVVIVTGGIGVGDTTSEAMVGRNYLARRGIPDSVIFMEARGLTTSESLHTVRAMVDELPGRSVLLVSDPFHMLRLSILAGRLGMEPYTSPTRTSPIAASPVHQLKYVLAESVKVPMVMLLEPAME
jgi:uncharacterized SAM-binding protein YcdF (DUF218 family)